MRVSRRVCIVEISNHMMKCWEYPLYVGISCLVIQSRGVLQQCFALLCKVCSVVLDCNVVPSL